MGDKNEARLSNSTLVSSERDSLKENRCNRRSFGMTDACTVNTKEMEFYQSTAEFQLHTVYLVLL